MYVQFKVMSLIIFLFTVDAKVHRFLMFNKKKPTLRNQNSHLPDCFPQIQGKVFTTVENRKRKEKSSLRKGV